MSRDEARLLDILKAARLAIEFVGPVGDGHFLADVDSESIEFVPRRGPTI